MKLLSTDELTQLVQSKNINNWAELTSFVKTIPYGRNANRTDFSLVIQENKGTCSSKHAFLKKIAELNDFQNVQLILGMYKMSELNTPKIGNELTEHDLDYIPEAHCYLKINGQRVDLTNATSSIEPIEKDILEELEISPEQVGTFKVDFHQDYLKNWLKEEKMSMPFEELWKIREQCIQNLTE